MKQRFLHHRRQLVIVNDALQLRISGTNHHAEIRSDTTVKAKVHIGHLSYAEVENIFE